MRLTAGFALTISIAGPLVAQPRQAHPEFVHGEECLFCHRNNVGLRWQTNRHASDPLARRNRATKPDGYGRLAIQEPDGSWNRTKFNGQCARCHATAVDPRDKTFAYTGIDCYACHGSVDLKHSGNPALVLFSKKRSDPVRITNGVCASCHLRGAPAYPGAFVPGDDWFQATAVDWRAGEKLNPGDGHVWRSAREERNCLDCHSVHGNSSRRHRSAAPGQICNDCHREGRPRKEVRRYEVHSPVCEY